MTDQPTQTREGCGEVWRIFDRVDTAISAKDCAVLNENEQVVPAAEVIARLVELQTALSSINAWSRELAGPPPRQFSHDLEQAEQALGRKP